MLRILEMTVNVRLVLSAFLLLFSSVSFADGTKIGVVEVTRLLLEAPQAAVVDKALEDHFAPLEEKLAKERDEVLKLEEKLRRDGVMMGANEKDALEKEIRERSRTFKRDWEAYREEFDVARNEALQLLQREVKAAILSVARAEKFDLIFSQHVLYASKELDITASVLKVLEKSAKEVEAASAKAAAEAGQ